MLSAAGVLERQEHLAAETDSNELVRIGYLVVRQSAARLPIVIGDLDRRRVVAQRLWTLTSPPSFKGSTQGSAGLQTICGQPDALNRGHEQTKQTTQHGDNHQKLNHRKGGLSAHGKTSQCWSRRT
jgi:hypothetical protein